MFEDLLQKNNMNMLQLSQRSGVGYNYIYKIVRNQTDFDRCGLETAKRIADTFGMDLNGIYDYKCAYFKRKIYYQDQTEWDSEKFGELNAELNKLFLIGIEYNFAPECMSRDVASCKQIDIEISCIKYDCLSEATKCIMVAILNQQKQLQRFVGIYNNLSRLLEQKPLKDALFLSSEPYDIFPSYSDMNIRY